jgi:type I restriction-modification system DNA methylase subunit
MNNYQTYINNFLFTQQFSNNLDNLGNINLSTSSSKESEIFIAFNLNDYNYDNDAITNLYDTTITTNNVINNNEIITISQDLQNSYDNAIAENQALQNSLGDLIAVVEANPAQAEAMASRDTIIALRIQLGEGASAADFSAEFPYNRL